MVSEDVPRSQVSSIPGETCPEGFRTSTRRHSTVGGGRLLWSGSPSPKRQTGTRLGRRPGLIEGDRSRPCHRVDRSATVTSTKTGTSTTRHRSEGGCRQSVVRGAGGTNPRDTVTRWSNPIPCLPCGTCTCVAQAGAPLTPRDFRSVTGRDSGSTEPRFHHGGREIRVLYRDVSGTDPDSETRS